MRLLHIKPVGNNEFNNFIIDSDNIYKVFASIAYESKMFIVEETAKEFLINMLDPTSYTSESEFYWEGNSFCPAIDAWFE